MCTGRSGGSVSPRHCHAVASIHRHRNTLVTHPLAKHTHNTQHGDGEEEILTEDRSGDKEDYSIYPSIQIKAHKVILPAFSPMIMMVILMMVTEEVMVMKLIFYIKICEYGLSFFQIIIIIAINIFISIMMI